MDGLTRGACKEPLMLDDRHTMLPQEIEPVPLTRSDIGKAGDLGDAPNVLRGSMGRRTRRNWYVAAAAGAILAGAGVWSLSAHTAMPEQGTVPPSPPVVTVALPLRENVTSRTELTGQFSAVNQVGLRAQVSGYLTEIHFQDGQIVHRGDLLFVIDPRPYEIRLAQANAQLQTVTARVALASSQLARAQSLRHNDFGTQETVDQRINERDAAEAAIEDAKARIRDARLDLEYCRVTAPFTGRIGARQVSIGSLVAGSRGAVSPPTLLTTLVSLDPL